MRLTPLLRRLALLPVEPLTADGVLLHTALPSLSVVRHASAVAQPTPTEAPAASPSLAATEAALPRPWKPSRRPFEPWKGPKARPKEYSDRSAALLDWEGNEVGAVALPGDIFNVPVRRDILHRVVVWQRNKARQGTHKVKTRAEVRGGGRKPHAQKGSGRARAGSIRAPHWRGGGVTHGPVVRSHATGLPKKVRRLGLKCALSARAGEGRLTLVASLAHDDPKTRLLDTRLAGLFPDAPRRSVLVMDSAKEGADGGEALRRMAANLPNVDVVPQCGANVYSILRRDQLLMTRPALDALVDRLRMPFNR